MQTITQTATCPRCLSVYDAEMPAMSRVTDERNIPICGPCGTLESDRLVPQSESPVDIEESRFSGDEGDLVVADFVEYSDKAQELTFSVECDMHRDNITGAIGLPFSQARALAEYLLEQIEWHMNPVDPRPTPECPQWCTEHLPDCEGAHIGYVQVNEIRLPIVSDPDRDNGNPTVETECLSWVNGSDLTDFTEAMRIADRMLNGHLDDEGADCD